MIELKQFYNQIRVLAMRCIKSFGFMDAGIISAYDQDVHSVKVRIMPGDVETDWIPLGEAWASQGAGTQFAPNVGDHVFLDYYKGSKTNPVVKSRYYNDDRPAPAVIQSGEFIIQHSSGSYIKGTNDGKITINGHVEIDLNSPKVVITTTGDAQINTGANATINATGTATLQGGTVNVTGNAVTFGDGAIPADFLAKYADLKSWCDAHVHGDPQGGNTTPSTTPLPASVATQVVKGA